MSANVNPPADVPVVVAASSHHKLTYKAVAAFVGALGGVILALNAMLDPPTIAVINKTFPHSVGIGFVLLAVSRLAAGVQYLQDKRNLTNVTNNPPTPPTSPLVITSGDN